MAGPEADPRLAIGDGASGAGQRPVSGPGQSPSPSARLLSLARGLFERGPDTHGVTATTTLAADLVPLSPGTLALDLSDPQQREFGEYELLEEAGRGGMGLVYRARQKRLDREVALKLLAAGPWASEEFIAGFRAEARNAAQLQHPGIVAIHDIGEHEGLVFYAMDLVRGESLARRIATGGPVPPRAAAALVRALADAVHYAHRMQVLHLDLKPANVLLDARGQALITDFGLSRQMDGGEAGTGGRGFGTPGYMAPEQIAGGAVSPATDVHGLGGILYQCLTGQAPFDQTVEAAGTRGTLPRPPLRPRQRVPGVPHDLEAIVLRCLAPDPAARYASADALADDLGRFLDGNAVSARPLGPLQRGLRWLRRERKIAIAVAVAAIALLAGLVATTVQWRRAETAAREIRESLWRQRTDDAAVHLQGRNPLAALPAMVDNLSEQEAAGADADATASRLRIASLLSLSPVLLHAFRTDGGIRTAVLDPAGDWIAVAGADGTLSRFDLDDGRLRWQTATGGSSFFWDENMEVNSLYRTGDGRSLLVATGNTIEPPQPAGEDEVRVDLQTGALDMPPPERFPDFVSTTFSPDGGHAFVLTRVAGSDDRFVGRVADARGWTPIGAAVDVALSAWLLAPHARALAHVGSDDLATRWARLELRDPRTMAVRWTHTRTPEARIRAWRFSGDGQTLAAGYETGEVRLFDVATGESKALSPQPASPISVLVFSEDDAWLAAGDVRGVAQVWSLDDLRLVALPVQVPSQRTDAIAEQARLVLDRSRRRLMFAIGPDIGLWRLPAAPGPAEALGVPARPPGILLSPAVDLAAAQGLFATATIEGNVRVWRLPESRVATVAAPPLHGTESSAPVVVNRLAVVEGADVKIVDPSDGTVVVPPIRHPQAVGFAGVDASGDVLASVAGHRLYLHGLPDARPLAAPIELESSPSGLYLPASGDGVLVSGTREQADQAERWIERFDPRSGQRLARTTLPHPGFRLRLSSDGSHLLAWRQDSLRVLDARTLQAAAPAPALSPDASLTMLMDVDGAGPRLWYATFAPTGFSIHARDLATERDIAVHELTGMPIALVALPGTGKAAVLLDSPTGLRIIDGSGGVRAVAIPAGDTPTALAADAEGSRLAVATRRTLQVFETAGGQWLTPPLPVPLAPGDAITGVKLDATGRQLAAHSRHDRSWRRDLAMETRDTARIRRLAAVLVPGGADTASAPPDARSDWPAQQDPGPPVPIIDTVADAEAPGRIVDVNPLPADDPALLDLRPACNLEFAASPAMLFGGLRLDAVLTRGRHRLLGVDYRLDCAVMTTFPNADVTRMHSREIPVPARPVTALHLLVTGATLLRDQKRQDAGYAVLHLHYRDGSTASRTLVYQREILEYWRWADGVSRARQAVVAPGGSRSNDFGATPRIFAIRIENPHPQKQLAAISLASARHLWSVPVLLAVTVE